MPSTLRPRHAAALAAALLLALAGFAAGPAHADPPPGVPPAVVAAAETAITEATLEAPIRFLADDLLEGRGPATRGDRLTQLYLASTMGLLGLEPAGPDGSWLQPFAVVGITSTVPKSWTFERGGESVTLDFWDEFIAGSGVQRERSTIEGAELVFVGYGIEAPEHEWDDFKGADLDGKVLVMLNNDPDWDPELFEGETRLYYGRWTYKYESAAAQGAVGAIIIHTTPSAGYPFQVVQTSWTGEQFELPAGDEPRLEVAAWTTEEAMKRLFALAGEDYEAAVEAAKSRDFRPIPLGVTTSLALANAISRVETANVAGLLPGGDPELADEVIVYTAHHDHLGIAPEGAEDRIYNGALDNASGVAQVLAIARAMSESPEPPRRSQLFLFVGAEEQGLLGSKFYAAHPTVEPGRIAANLNFDGANIWGETRDLTVIGKGKSDLDAVAEAVAAAQGRKVLADQFPDRGYYYRSDQFSFAKIGVPALYFDTGTDFVDRPEGWGKERVDEWTGEHYHQPSDELIDDWDFSGMVEDCRLGFYAGWLVSQADAMPAWTPGDEFEAARREAIEALGEE
ncbi:MAG TPA: M28 family peptidase [Thermoanaerobaculia bacterium]|nr:M28 family peptidase [Thermoanaerobaculia bacterium]